MNILMVVGDSTALGAGDTAIQGRLQTTLGHTVTVVDDQAVAPSLAGYNLVVMAPSCNYNFVGTKYDTATCGVFAMRVEPHSEMTADSFPSGGNTSSNIYINAPGDPLVGGLSGDVTLLNSTPTGNYQFYGLTSMAPDVVVVGLSSNGGTRVLLARVVQGGTLMNDQVATTRRVVFGIENDWPPLFNANGWTIFDNSVAWASVPPGQLPVANAGPDQEVDVSTTVQLTGAASNDADGSVATYTWRLVSTTGPSVTLSATNGMAPTFTAPNIACTLVFGLRVTDNESLKSAENTVTIQVVDHMNINLAVGSSWVRKHQFSAKGGSWY